MTRFQTCKNPPCYKTTRPSICISSNNNNNNRLNNKSLRLAFQIAYNKINRFIIKCKCLLADD